MSLPRDRGDERRSAPPGAPLMTVVSGAGVTGGNGAGSHAANGDGIAVNPTALAGTLKHHLNVQSNLCAALEQLADGLPSEVRNDDCLALARSVYPIVHRSHKFEERELFPYLKANCAGRDNLAVTLDRLHGEHWEDEAYAEEVQHELMAFAADREAVDVEKLGYMLRGFFVGVRRHLAFEREHILPMIEAVEKT